MKTKWNPQNFYISDSYVMAWPPMYLNFNNEKEQLNV